MSELRRVRLSAGTSYLTWAGLYAAALAVTQLPGDPSGDVPLGWIVVVSGLALLSWRGSRWARAFLVVAQALFLTTFFGLALPIGAQLAAFYALLLAALCALLLGPSAPDRSTAGAVEETAVA